MAINLNNYETVKMRKKRFYADYPDGRIIVEIQNTDVLEHALFKATIYKNGEDQKEGRPFSTGYAHEIRDKELKVSGQGKSYESVNFTSWVENCEESAIGRGLDNAGYAGNDKCSQEEMKKVQNKLDQKPKGNLEGILTVIGNAKTFDELNQIRAQANTRSWNDDEVAKIDDQMIIVKGFIETAAKGETK